MPTKVPTTIFTGFLGSGKTTIIADLIAKTQAQGQQIVFIKNELGEVDIDATIMRKQHVLAKELLNGCICCTLVGPFLSAINEVIDEFHPDRIIIEASGAADPAAIALMVSSHPRLYRDAVICVVDVTTFEGYKDLSQTARNQAHFTDIILLNKIELVDDAQKRAVVGYIRELNQTSPIVEAPGGKIAAGLVFGTAGAELPEKLSDYATDEAAQMEHHHHLDQDHLSSLSFHATMASPVEALSAVLQKLPKQVFRVKGWVTVGNQLYLVNKVGSRCEIAPWGSEQPTTADQTPENRLVLIGFELEHIATELAALLQPVQFLPG